MGAEGGNEPGLRWQLPIVLPGIGRARHDTPPSAPIWVPPLRSPAPERPALLNEFSRDSLGSLRRTGREVTHRARGPARARVAGAWAQRGGPMPPTGPAPESVP